MEKTLHFTERQARINFIINEIGLGTPVRTFYWDKDHENGAELHTITSTGIIIIRNDRTNKLITLLIARPAQIIRYWKSRHERAPKELIEIARKHQELEYNYK